MAPIIQSASIAKGRRTASPFHPYYTIKDMFGLGVFLVVFAIFVFFLPNYLNGADAYIPANPLQTPAEIVPQWYFLPFYYAILRSIPNKLAGVIAMFAAVGILFRRPWLDTSKGVRSGLFPAIYKWVFWLLVIDVTALGLGRRQSPGGPLRSRWPRGDLLLFRPFPNFLLPAAPGQRSRGRWRFRAAHRYGRCCHTSPAGGRR